MLPAQPTPLTLAQARPSRPDHKTRSDISGWILHSPPSSEPSSRALGTFSITPKWLGSWSLPNPVGIMDKQAALHVGLFLLCWGRFGRCFGHPQLNMSSSFPWPGYSLMLCGACLTLAKQHRGTHIQPHQHHRAHPALECSRSGLAQPKHSSHGIWVLREPLGAAGCDDGDGCGRGEPTQRRSAAAGRKNVAASHQAPHVGSISALIWQRVRAAPVVWHRAGAGSNVCSGGCRAPRAAS